MNSCATFRFAALLIFTAAANCATTPPPLRLTHTIPLPGVTGRIDHFACDPANQRLIVAALGNDSAEVIDLAKLRHQRSIPSLSKPTGVLILEAEKRIFVANGTEGALRVFDGLTFKQVARTRDLDDADNLRFDPAAKLIYLGYGDGALGVIDPTTNTLLDRIPLAAHPEAFQLEAKGPRIFVNVPDANQISVVDRIRKTVVANWPLAQWRGNFPMALDESRHRLFIGCRHPARLVVIDTESGAAVSDLEISGDTDDVFFDAMRRRLYLTCGAGFIDVVQCRDGDRYERIARLPTSEGARTGWFSPELDLLFLAAPKRFATEAEIRIYQPQ